MCLYHIEEADMSIRRNKPLRGKLSPRSSIKPIKQNTPLLREGDFAL
jgi:hypothetical protein